MSPAARTDVSPPALGTAATAPCWRSRTPRPNRRCPRRRRPRRRCRVRPVARAVWRRRRWARCLSWLLAPPCDDEESIFMQRAVGHGDSVPRRPERFAGDRGGARREPRPYSPILQSIVRALLAAPMPEMPIETPARDCPCFAFAPCSCPETNPRAVPWPVRPAPQPVPPGVSVYALGRPHGVDSILS